MSMTGTLVQISKWILESVSKSKNRLTTYSGVGLLTYLLYIFFLKPFRHPLRKLPGMHYYNPILGNFKEITSGETMDIDMDKVACLIKKHGSLFRFYFPLGKPFVMVADSDTIKHVLVTNVKNYTKPNIPFMKVFRTIIGNGLIFLEGAEHATHKRLMSPSFNNASIKKMIPIFEEAGHRLTNLWLDEMSHDGSGSAVVAVQNDLSRTTLDVIGKAAFGYDFNSIENPDDEISDAFKRFIEGRDISGKMVIPYYFDLPLPDNLRLRKSVKVMHNKVLEIVENKRRQLDEGKDTDEITGDILGIMMMARDEDSGRGLSNTELMDEVMTVMAAGHETTSTAMAWFLLCMAQHPDVQEKCREEVREHLPSQSVPITWEVLDQMEYLESAIKEAMRMYPSVPMVVRQSVGPDVFMDKYHIPEKTVIFVPIGPRMRSPDLFDEPDTFMPERFSKSDEANKNLYRYLPFIIGPRMCLGYKFAMLEMKAILSCLLRQFHFQMLPDTSFTKSTKNRITMRPDPPLRLQATQIEM